MKVFRTKLQRNANKNFNHLFVFSRAVNTYYNRRELQAYSYGYEIKFKKSKFLIENAGH